MKPYRVIEHTADIGIHVTGRTLKELFVNTAEGMVALVCAGARRGAGRWRKGSGPPRLRRISLKAGITEQLLVMWLEEMLFLFTIKKLVPVSFKILELKGGVLKAEVQVVLFNPDVHRPGYDIKAVTYHNLAVKKKKAGFETSVIFDI